MPKKGDDIQAITAAAAVDHHGVDVTVGADTFRAIIHRGIEMIDPESGTSAYSDAAEIRNIDLSSHAMGDLLTVVSTSEEYKLQKTIKDDGHVRLIELTR